MPHDLTGLVVTPPVRALLTAPDGGIDRARLARLANVLSWAVAETRDGIHVVAPDTSWRPALLVALMADILALPDEPAARLRARLPAMAA